MTMSTPVSYSDRSLAPNETWERIKPLLLLLGITRVSRLTGLDRIGIPVWNAVTPNAKSIVISQGKGIEDIDAKVSAAMEAIERAIAGSPQLPVVTTTRASLLGRGSAVHCLDELVAPGASDISDDEMLDWVKADDLLGDKPCYLPYSALLLDRTQEGSRFWQSSDGLASGNTRNEAILHGLLERIERDAYILWQMTPPAGRHAIAPASLEDGIVDALVEKITDAGLTLRLFDMTTDLGVPCYTALIAPSNFSRRKDLKFFEVNMGSGAHPHAVRAAIRAITEAAQSRMTFVSGARDDIAEDAFTRACPQDTRVCLEAVTADKTHIIDCVPGSVETLLQWVLQKLRSAGISTVAVVDLGSEAPCRRRESGRARARKSGGYPQTPLRNTGAPARYGRDMRVVFVGPSLPDARGFANYQIQTRPPAARGDIYRAVCDGARMIGLIDGYFEQTAAVWHKEILYALSRGVGVIGAASMGALRAVECECYGMTGIGRIFDRFQQEQSVDDADVAQVHGPPETGYIALSEPLVNIIFTLEAWTDQGIVSNQEATAISSVARTLFFKDRTWRHVIGATGFTKTRREELLVAAQYRKINQKRFDALELIRLIAGTPSPPLQDPNWTFQPTAQWKALTSFG